MESQVDCERQELHNEVMTKSTDNTEGSLTEEQKEILVGTLLGDGAMRKKMHALLEINHLYNQKAYVDWLYQKFKYFVGTQPKIRKTNGNRIAYRFTTRSLPQFTKYYDLFFREKRKHIPVSLNLQPSTLAVWYMDDGSRCDKDIYLNTQQYSQEEQHFLTQLLSKQLLIKATLNKDEQYWRIRIWKDSVSHFMNLIFPYIIPTMKYKLLL